MMSSLLRLSLACLLPLSGCAGEPSGPRCEEPSRPGGHWEVVSPPPRDVAPGTVQGLVATWTGEELLIWGRPGERKEVDGEEVRPQAAAYDPSTRTWRDITPYGSGQEAVRPGTAWTGEEWIVWGGEISRDGGVRRVSNTGVRINPVTGSWQVMSAAPISGRALPYTVWTGQEVLFWGGGTEDLNTAQDGAAYEPHTDTWRSISTDGALTRNVGQGSWTGSRLLFWNVPAEGERFAVQYDPAEDRWSPIPTEGAPHGTRGMVWTGEELLVWGYSTSSGYTVGGAYDPEQGTWRRLSTKGAPAAFPNRQSEYPVWSGDRMFVWGEYSSECRVGGFYDLKSDTWTTFTSQGAPSLRYDHSLAWTGHSLLVFGGLGGSEGRWDQWQGGEFFPDP